ncbi:MAG: hypothetical protein ACHP7H_00775 [Hyphomicrobiales bacterium]
MAFEGLHQVKEAYGRMEARLHNLKKKAEKSIEQTLAIVEVNAATFAWGYVNERFGDKTDELGLHEYKLAGVPVDLGVGLALLGISLFGGLGKYDEHGLNLGNGSTSAFSYRLGGELGRRSRDGGSGKPAAKQVTSGTGPNGGRMHSVEHAYAGT